MNTNKAVMLGLLDALNQSFNPVVTVTPSSWRLTERRESSRSVNEPRPETYLSAAARHMHAGGY